MALSALLATATLCACGDDGDGQAPADAAGNTSDGASNQFDADLVDAQAAAPAVVVEPQAGLQTTEAGGTATFTMVLAAEPNSAVSIDLASNDPGEGTADVSNVTFGLDNWDVPVTITVTGDDDNQTDGDIIYSIVTENTVSADPNYDDLVVPDVVIANVDNDAV